MASFQSTEFPVVRFGVLTDTQYADCDSKPAWYNPNLTRYYRTSLDQIDKAFDFWAQDSVSFALQLGDIIDGVNRHVSDSDVALQTVLSKFELNKNIPTFHTVGNHELYNFNRQDLSKYFYDYLDKMNLSANLLGLPKNGNLHKAEASCAGKYPKVHSVMESCTSEEETEDNGSGPNLGTKIQGTNGLPSAEVENEDQDLPYLYYAFRPVEGMKFISLDCFEVSVIGYEKENHRFKEAAAILFEHHGHEDFEGWDCADLLQGSQKRFQQMNGAVSQEQLRWLDQELLESDLKGEKVVVFGHVCLHPDSADWDCMLWNYDQVLDIFDKHSCVILYLCGHTHQNGYAVDRNGIHYVVMAGIIETAPDECAFATVAIYRNRIEIIGHGRETSRTLGLDRLTDEFREDETDLKEETPVSPSSIKVVV